MTLLDSLDIGVAIMNVIVVVWLVLGFIIGFWTGFLNRTIKIIEMFVIVFIAVFLKNPISALLYKNLPFFKFDVQVVNIILYEAISFILLVIILVIIIKLINSLFNLVEAFFSFILGMGFPSRILGAVIGFCEGAFYLYIFVFIVLFFSTLFKAPIGYSLGDRFFYDAPILNVTLGPSLKSSLEITKLATTNDDKEVVDKNALDILLRYKILSKDNAQYLLDNKKIDIKDAQLVINRY